MSLQGAQTKSLCAAIITVRDKEKETETADTERAREVDIEIALCPPSVYSILQIYNKKYEVQLCV